VNSQQVILHDLTSKAEEEGFKVSIIGLKTVMVIVVCS